MQLEKLIVVLSALFTGTVVGFAPQPSFVSVRAMGGIPTTEPLGQTTAQHEFPSVSPENSDSASSSSSSSYTNEEDKFSLPWTDFQEWALRDNILKYVVSVPRKGADKPELYALWRSMSREVVELSGYPVDMLREKYRKQLTDEPGQMSSNPGILPLLDDYEFEISGGLSGRVYGIPGVADGSKIETTSVSEVQLTLPKGYVLTDDGAVVYELGTPMRDSYNTLDGAKQSASSMASSMASSAIQTAGVVTQEALTTSGDAVPGGDMLVRLGASTGILLAGATAINMLSHHMTVNVFWV